MKKVVFIVTKSIVGGAQTWIKDQIDLLEGDIEPIIITNERGWLSDSVGNVKCFFVPGIESKFSIKALLTIVSILKNNNVELIIASSANAGLYSRLSRIFYNTKIIYVSHGWSCIYNGGRFKLAFIKIEKILSYLTDKILCVSEKDAKNAKDIIGIPEHKIVTIRNAVPPQKVKTTTRGTKLKILFLGRLSHPKRLDLLIDAVNKFDNVHLTVVGDGPDRHLYKGSENVKILGEIRGFDKFSEYDVFALISDSEGLPISALEAASSGLPLILSDVGGCHELVTNNGLMIKNTVEEVVNAIAKIECEYDLYFSNAKNKIDEYNINRVKGLYKELYI